ncbi:alpha/beta hydrolase [Pseudonocardia cypriaca]|uniref:Pimeloyl-ACP methyl ester carboxylesterase n=1 Tax=Pseudonocardia cypriaca TaxID=882449 RepID=A0A543FPA5_9PSEU|nr:alpha/beta fold hydrolase [Pseudonocardia cypriaca]TQM35651.1 pimeloyl-ACP methyl ester carboxylesterase [Pseudonocardia cypriaca]
MTTTRFLTRPGGRRIAVRDLTPDAPADAPVVLFCHIAPGSGEFDPDPEVTAARGVRLITVDRPGYGGSEPAGDEFASVGLVTDDAIAVLEDVLAPGATAGVVGWSAGGRVALSVAARRPDLVSRVAVIGTPAPDDAVSWIPEEYKAGIEALRGASAADAHAALTAAMGPMVESLAGDDRFAVLGVGEADGAVMARPGVADRLRGMVDEAFAQGAAGMVADVAGYTLQPWGFEPADVTADVLLGYGADDPLGEPHGRWWEQELPKAHLEVVPDVGHVVVVPFWDRALEHVTPGR